MKTHSEKSHSGHQARPATAPAYLGCCAATRENVKRVSSEVLQTRAASMFGSSGAAVLSPTICGRLKQKQVNWTSSSVDVTKLRDFAVPPPVCKDANKAVVSPQDGSSSNPRPRRRSLADLAPQKLDTSVIQRRRSIGDVARPIGEEPQSDAKPRTLSFNLESDAEEKAASTMRSFSRRQSASIRSCSASTAKEQLDMDGFAVHAAISACSPKTRVARRVWFTSNDELFEAFTPYGLKYGFHPSEFVFDRDLNMIAKGKIEKGATVQCLMGEGVSYRSKPQMDAVLEHKRVWFGQTIVVDRQCTGWVKDKVGWLPLKVNGEDAFEAVVMLNPTGKSKLQLATPKLPAQPWADDEGDVE